ncbi:MAG: glutaredoxin family protein [Coraliomargarita sp.]
MSFNQSPVLYVKAGCPWCEAALDYFKKERIDLEVREVRSNRPFMEQMVRISGQTKAPTFVHGDFVVADFDIDEFKAAIHEAPAVKAELGL